MTKRAERYKGIVSSVGFNRYRVAEIEDGKRSRYPICIDNFDPLLEKLKVGQTITFEINYPGDHRAVAQKVKIYGKR